jgi:hypothetical protein
MYGAIILVNRTTVGTGKDSTLSVSLQPAMFCDDLFTYTPAMMDAFLVQKAAISYMYKMLHFIISVFLVD